MRDLKNEPADITENTGAALRLPVFSVLGFYILCLDFFNMTASAGGHRRRLARYSVVSGAVKIFVSLYCHVILLP